MTEGFKIWIKAIPGGWRFFGAVVGFASIISVGTIKVYKWQNKDKAQSDVITYLQKEDTIRKKEDKIKWQMLYNRLDNMSDSLNTNYKNTNQLTGNYVAFVKKNSATVDDFVSAVNGLEVVVVKSEEKSTDGLNFKMIIQKKIK